MASVASKKRRLGAKQMAQSLQQDDCMTDDSDSDSDDAASDSDIVDDDANDIDSADDSSTDSDTIVDSSDVEKVKLISLPGRNVRFL